jgi:hypothetical protein
MVSFLISIPLIALTLWLVARTTLRMWRLKAGWRWWTVLGGIVLCGGYAGFRLGYCEIQVSPTFRWGGLPLPIGFFELEGDRWTDFIPPPPVQWTNFLADILSPVLLSAIPVAIFWWRRARTNPQRGVNIAGSAQSFSTTAK